jgi:hypothetical protein
MNKVKGILYWSSIPITYMLCEYIPFGYGIIIFNSLLFVITALILNKVANMDSLNKRSNLFNYAPHDYLIFPYIFSYGLIICIYKFLIFALKPVKKGQTLQEYNANILSNDRDKKIEKLLNGKINIY